jgi:hypothetical protein
MAKLKKKKNVIFSLKHTYRLGRQKESHSRKGNGCRWKIKEQTSAILTRIAMKRLSK